MQTRTTQTQPRVQSALAADPAAIDRSVFSTVRAYLALTKPRIIELLLVTTVPTMILAAGEVPPVWLMAATIIGGTLSAGGANAFNCWYDRDIDAVMNRTAERPLPTARVSTIGALIFSASLVVVGFVWMAVTVNVVAAALATSAALFYIFIYTMGLKRTTVQNIVIGGAAGAAPVLTGWAAVTETVPVSALLLFFLIFYWTPPHFWTLAIKYRDDYARAGVPMLPVVSGLKETGRQIFRYSLIMFAISLLFGAVATMGWIYLGTSVVLGAVFIAMAADVRRDPSVKKAMRLFHYSISYLALMFAAIAVDTLVST